MRRLTFSQALACELAEGGRCRCRCRGVVHGARRVVDELGLVGLAAGDPHFVAWEQLRLPLEGVLARAVAGAS